MSINIGVIGTGGIGQGHIERLNNQTADAKVVAVNDINKETAAIVGEKYGAKVYDNPHVLIDAPDVDAILVASWDPTHEEFCTAAIRAGKPVFCEKPLADTSEGCKRIMQEEMKTGKRLLFLGFMRRYDAGYRELRYAIESGRLGNPLILHCKHRNMHPSGAAHTTDMSVTGSLVHEFDVIRYLIGEDDPYISAQLVCPRRAKYADEDLIDPQLIYLETKSGIRINLETFVNCHYGYDVQCEVVGDEASASLPDPSHIQVREAGTIGFEIKPSWQDRFPEAYVVEMNEWVSDIKSGIVTGPSAWDGYVTAKVAECCIESRETKQIVPIDLGECPAFYKK